MALTGLWCLSVPDIYVSQVKVTDELKESDILIGLDQLNVMMRDLNPDAHNESQNNIEVYSKILSSEDFLHELSQVQLPGYNTTYSAYAINGRKQSWWDIIASEIDRFTGDYSDEGYVADVMRNSLKYNISTKYRTLVIQFEDTDAKIAALMTDSATAHLQQRICDYRRKVQQSQMDEERRACQEAHDMYKKAQERYDMFMEAHSDITTKDEELEQSDLEKEMNTAFGLYTKRHERYTRAYALSRKSVASFATVRNATVAQKPASPTPFPIFLALSTILITLLTLYNNIKKAKEKGSALKTDWGGIFAPWTLMLVHWGAILLLFAIESDLLEPLSEQFYTSLIIWVSAFTLTSFVTYQFLPRSSSLSTRATSYEINTLIFNLFFWISVIITPLHLYQIMKIVTQFDPTDMLNNIRIFAVSGNGAGILNYSYVINQVMLVVAMCRFPKIEKWRLAIIVICTLISAFAVMEKGIILYLIIIVLFACYEKHYISLRTIGFTLLLATGVFFFFTLAREVQSDDTAEEMTFIDFFAIYVLSGPVAFGRLMEDLTMQFGANTFQTVYLFLNRIFPGQYEVHQALQEFVWVPLPTNVYTVLQPFYIDFGYVGVGFFGFIYGLACAYAYRSYRNGSAFGFCMYAYFADVLIVQFHQEEIFFGMVHFIQFTFFVWLFTQNRIKTKLSTI